MTQDKIWAIQTSGWGGLQRGNFQNSDALGGTKYILATPAREADEDMLKALRDMTALAIQLGAIDTEVERACAVIERAQGGAA